MASSVLIEGSSARDAIGGIVNRCEHPKVMLKRAKHFDISATCQSCRHSVLIRNAFVESWNVIAPKVNWSKGSGGDSMLPKGDSRLL